MAEQKIYEENFREKIFVKGVKNFSGRGKIQGEIVGRFGGKKNLRHTDVIGRGNVGSMMNVRDFHLGGERNWGDDRKG